MADQDHGFVAAKTSWRRCGRRDLRQRSFPIEQGQDALPSGFGSGTEPAEIADALKAFRQDVLEETAQELRDAELQDMPLLIEQPKVFVAGRTQAKAVGTNASHRSANRPPEPRNVREMELELSAPGVQHT